MNIVKNLTSIPPQELDLYCNLKNSPTSAALLCKKSRGKCRTTTIRSSKIRHIWGLKIPFMEHENSCCYQQLTNHHGSGASRFLPQNSPEIEHLLVSHLMCMMNGQIGSISLDTRRWIRSSRIIRFAAHVSSSSSSVVAPTSSASYA